MDTMPEIAKIVCLAVAGIAFLAIATYWMRYAYLRATVLVSEALYGKETTKGKSDEDQKEEKR